MWSPSERQAASSLRIKLSLRQELAQANSLAKGVSWDLDELTPNFGSTVGFLHGLGQITTSPCSLSLQTKSSLFFSHCLFGAQAFRDGLLLLSSCLYSAYKGMSIPLVAIRHWCSINGHCN